MGRSRKMVIVVLYPDARVFIEKSPFSVTDILRVEYEEARKRDLLRPEDTNLHMRSYVRFDGKAPNPSNDSGLDRPTLVFLHESANASETIVFERTSRWYIGKGKVISVAITSDGCDQLVATITAGEDDE